MGATLDHTLDPLGADGIPRLAHVTVATTGPVTTEAAQRRGVRKPRYAAMRARGHSHGRARRQIADQILHVAFAMLRNRTT